MCLRNLGSMCLPDQLVGVTNRCLAGTPLAILGKLLPILCVGELTGPIHNLQLR